MERGGYTVTTTYASSCNISFRGCSKFVSGPVFLSRKCAKACNRSNFSLLQKFFFGQPNVNLLTSQFSSVAPPPVTCSNPPGPTKSLEKLLGARKVFPPPFPPVTCPTKGQKTFRGPESFSTAPPPVTCLNPPGPTKAQRTLNLDGTRRGNKFRI